MNWLGCTRQCKKNWKQHNILNKSKFFLQYLINGLECTVQNISMSLNTLFKLHMKSIKQVEYQQNFLKKLLRKLLNKGKTITTETLHLVTNVYEYDNFSRYVPGKKDSVSASKVAHKQRLRNLQLFVTCKNYTLLSKKNTQIKISGSQSSLP